MRKNGEGINVRKIISCIIIIAIFAVIYNILMNYYFSDFMKAVNEPGITEFRRDRKVKYSDIDSYRLDSKTYNDAMFCKEIEVVPNTSYRVSCMIRTENVETQNGKFVSGAQICIANSYEASRSITGTSEWQKVELMFNSLDRETVIIGFRLGGYEDSCKGTAWFSDFEVQMGIENTDTNWNFACFVFENIEVNVQGKEIKLSMNESDANVAYENMERFKRTCKELSINNMSVSYDIYRIKDSITSLSYDETNGYYVGPGDVDKLIERYINEKEYDHIFVVVRLGDENKNIEIPVHDWIGLGSMDYLGIGFSNIRLPNERNNYIYTYSASSNMFPEEVFLHEFLHSLERDLIEYGYDIPELHDYEKYGYTMDKLTGLKKWYGDYMSSNILDTKTGKHVGLDKIVYKLKPVHNSNFEYSREVDIGKRKDNIIDVILNSLKVINTKIDLKKGNATVESFRI